MATIDDTTLETLQHALMGTCTSLGALIEQYELEIDALELEDRLLDGQHATEICRCCEWWHGVGDLEFYEEKHGGVCSDCARDEELMQ